MSTLDAKRILVPIDFSDSARAALAEADILANTGGGSLTLLHVYAINQVAFMDFTYVEPPEKVAAICEAAESELTAWARDLHTKAANVSTTVHTGSPAAEILKLAAEHDLVVMGTHGRTGLDRLLTGSVAQRVIQGAHCPVLVVKLPL